MPTPADQLRQAAQQIRDRANAATPGPWAASDTYPHVVFQGGEDYMVSTNLAGKPREDGAHIAAWHPAVALAVADWLDTGASPYACVDREPMLAVARAYLGTTEEVTA